MSSLSASSRLAAILIASIAATASSLSAGIDVTHATVYEDYTANLPAIPQLPPVRSTLLESSSSGNTFDTYDGEAGLTSTLTPTGGTLTPKITGIEHYPTAPGYAYYSTSGVVDFTPAAGLSRCRPQDSAGQVARRPSAISTPTTSCLSSRKAKSPQVRQ